MTNKTFCILPWIHLHAWAGGEVYPCCTSNIEPEHQFGNLQVQSLEQLYNSDKIKAMRHRMLSDIPSESCTRCYDQEKLGFKSMRQNMNENFVEYFDLVEKTDPDGHCHEMKLVYWDIRFSNNCNLKCRTCGPDFSTLWYDDMIKIHGKEFAAKTPRVKKVRTDFKTLLDESRDQIKYFKQIYFAGGEALIMPEHWEFVDEVIKQENFDVQIHYQTNFSQLTYKDRSAIDLWRNLKNVTVNTSMDAAGPLGDYIRYGSNWNEYLENILKVKSELPRIPIYVTCTVSALNVLHIVELHKFLYENNYVDIDKFVINPVFNPDWYRVDILPDQLKEVAIQKITDHVAYLETLENRLKNVAAAFRSVINMLNQPSRHHLFWQQFCNTTKQLDKIRGEDIFAVLPEYREYFV